MDRKRMNTTYKDDKKSFLEGWLAVIPHVPCRGSPDSDATDVRGQATTAEANRPKWGLCTQRRAATG